MNYNMADRKDQELKLFENIYNLANYVIWEHIMLNFVLFWHRIPEML